MVDNIETSQKWLDRLHQLLQVEEIQEWIREDTLTSSLCDSISELIFIRSLTDNRMGESPSSCRDSSHDYDDTSHRDNMWNDHNNHDTTHTPQEHAFSAEKGSSISNPKGLDMDLSYNIEKMNRQTRLLQEQLTLEFIQYKENYIKSSRHSDTHSTTDAPQEIRRKAPISRLLNDIRTALHDITQGAHITQPSRPGNRGNASTPPSAWYWSRRQTARLLTCATGILFLHNQRYRNDGHHEEYNHDHGSLPPPMAAFVQRYQTLYRPVLQHAFRASNVVVSRIHSLFIFAVVCACIVVGSKLGSAAAIRIVTSSWSLMNLGERGYKNGLRYHNEYRQRSYALDPEIQQQIKLAGFIAGALCGAGISPIPLARLSSLSSARQTDLLNNRRVRSSASLQSLVLILTVLLTFAMIHGTRQSVLSYAIHLLRRRLGVAGVLILPQLERIVSSQMHAPGGEHTAHAAGMMAYLAWRVIWGRGDREDHRDGNVAQQIRHTLDNMCRERWPGTMSARL
eukprot:gb/GECH01007309.1/.p1 GENE.gb/GECH01007309.1/~~gb/GECH01007309.1/.p1  ORF type:complete len:510 (+),score=82.74 gb/GECH01007309.1/:1-1530(+)